MLKRVLPIVLTMLFLAGVAKADDLLDGMQKKYEAMTSLSAEFEQVLFNTASGEEDKRSGSIAFKKPQLIRWETLEPEKELIVIGQDEVWDYIEEEMVAYKYTREYVLDSKTMIRFISGQANLEEDFYIEREGEEEGLVKLSLTPMEPEPQLVHAYLWVDPKTKLFKRITLMDFYGNENTLTFTSLEENPDLADDLFEFTPPEDVDIMDNSEDMPAE